MRIGQNDNNVNFKATLDIQGLRISSKNRAILEKTASEIGEEMDSIHYKFSHRCESRLPSGVVGDIYTRSIVANIDGKRDTLITQVSAVAGHKPVGEITFLKNYLTELAKLKNKKNVSNIEK